MLLQHIHVDSTNNDGKTALHEAASASHTDIIRLLIDNGASIDFLKMADWYVVIIQHTPTGLGVGIKYEPTQEPSRLSIHVFTTC